MKVLFSPYGLSGFTVELHGEIPSNQVQQDVAIEWDEDCINYLEAEND